MADISLPFGPYKGIASGFWKMVEIPNGHMSPGYIGRIRLSVSAVNRTYSRE